MDAYRYIATLQQQVQDLTFELLGCEELDSCHQEQTLSQHSKIPDPEPMVSNSSSRTNFLSGYLNLVLLCFAECSIAGQDRFNLDVFVTILDLVSSEI